MECLRWLWAVAKSASWIVPHERVCWIAERPEALRTDAGDRLHCVDGPALRYRDDWSAYAWKGVQTPAWMIEHPERINRSRISKTFEPALRNAMIDIHRQRSWDSSNNCGRPSQRLRRRRNLLRHDRDCCCGPSTRHERRRPDRPREPN